MSEIDIVSDWWANQVMEDRRIPLEACQDLLDRLTEYRAERVPADVQEAVGRAIAHYISELARKYEGDDSNDPDMPKWDQLPDDAEPGTPSKALFHEMARYCIAAIPPDPEVERFLKVVSGTLGDENKSAFGSLVTITEALGALEQSRVK